MATWQLGGLPSMAPQNDNAPRSSVPQPVQYQQQPNVPARERISLLVGD